MANDSKPCRSTRVHPNFCETHFQILKICKLQEQLRHADISLVTELQNHLRLKDRYRKLVNQLAKIVEAEDKED